MTTSLANTYDWRNATRNERNTYINQCLGRYPHPDDDDGPVEREGRFKGYIYLYGRKAFVCGLGHYYTKDDPAEYLEFDGLNIDLDEFYFVGELAILRSEFIITSNGIIECEREYEDEEWIYDHCYNQVVKLTFSGIVDGDIELDGDPV